MIGQHCELMALPELKLFAYSTLGELAASLPHHWIARGAKHRSPGLVRAIAHFEFGGQAIESIDCALKWLDDRSHWSGADVLDFLQDRISPRIAVEKSPENVESDAALARLSNAYPQARYLHLTRHPVTTQRSMQEHLNRTVPEYPSEAEPMSGIATWVETHTRILRFTANLPNHACKRMKAEDVLNDADEQLRSIADWLDIRCDDAAIDGMKHPEASPFAKPGPASSGVVGGNDPSFLLNPVPHPVEVASAVERPAGWVGYASLWSRTVDLAMEMGYP
jgi:hypothetical protein